MIPWLLLPDGKTLKEGMTYAPGRHSMSYLRCILADGHVQTTVPTSRAQHLSRPVPTQTYPRIAVQQWQLQLLVINEVQNRFLDISSILVNFIDAWPLEITAEPTAILSRM